ncbi:acetyl-CoA synthetase-like protein [Aspergillus heteromorphus CBS 117.55]|uniref:Acetyl-CoA synthetase-like protein n=1 Tax=Aspergillus heteromorphus CBS 117.55 TaxID=1448321 RepID=A0A317WHM2_9EURO|nr:acetyl-CoA synthetase-like protein [Aspergillus heteromorphus CBS 117.55]PWY85946.1 acetyl-CoA synthetase-like protein [Aspergillus heteromorphus CBS 117.55]
MHTSASQDFVSFALKAQHEYDASKPLIVDAHDPTRTLNSTQFRLLVHTLIAGFKAQSPVRRDCVLLHLANHLSPTASPSDIISPFQVLYPALFLSIIGAGGVCMGSSPHSQRDELDHLVRLTNPQWIIAEDDALPTVLPVSAKNSISAENILLLDDVSLTSTLNSLRPGAQSQPQTPRPRPPEQTPSSPSFTTAPRLPSQSRLISLPMFHLFSSLWTHLFPLRYGHPRSTSSGASKPHLFLDAIRQYEITETYLVPTMVHLINQAPKTLDVTRSISSLRYVDVPRRRNSRIPCTSNPARARSGELYIRGPGLFKGHIGHGEQEDVDAEGWFRTGDVAYEKNGQYFIVGRSKALIKVRGSQVCPTEIEAVLLLHPPVSDVASYKVLDGILSLELASMNERREALAGLLQRTIMLPIRMIVGIVSVQMGDSCARRSNRPFQPADVERVGKSKIPLSWRTPPD